GDARRSLRSRREHVGRARLVDAARRGVRRCGGAERRLAQGGARGAGGLSRMLRAVWLGDAGVLNGGWRKWPLEGRAVSTEPCAYPPGRFVAKARPSLFVGKDAVLAGLEQRATCLVNALTEEQHRGTGGVTYGRPGRIAGS